MEADIPEPDYAIESLTAFIDLILEIKTPASRLSTYRGHASTEFKLHPSIFRKPAFIEQEHILLRELIAAHPEDFHGDTSALEMLVRMQHYTLPTRLMDVSMNPLVSLYFACESIKRRVPIANRVKPTYRNVECDGHIVILTVPKRRIRYFDSDTVSCLTNLARLRADLKKVIDTDLEFDEFNKSTSVKRLHHFINQEKHGFLPEINPKDLEEIILVKPKQNNKRILAQAGAFFAFGLSPEIKDNNSFGIKITRILVEAEAKKEILNQLDKLGINEKTMFPEIDRAARYITGSLTTGEAASKILTRLRID
jgi:hypothetical protein